MSDRKKVITDIIGNETVITDDLLSTLVHETLSQTTNETNYKIQELLVEKERLEQEIKTQTHKLQELRQETFKDIEEVLTGVCGELSSDQLKRLTQLQLQSIDILDILSEITESAFIAAIENGDKIEASFREITRDLTHKTLRDGYLTLDRAKQVIQTIMSVAIDLATATPNISDEILRGSVYGCKKGLTQSIKIFKEQFAYLPDQLDERQLKSMRQTYQDLQNTDTIFIHAVQHQANLADQTIKEKTYFILERMRPDLSDLINISKETLLLVGDRLGKVGKKAMIRSERVLHSKAAEEAKKMGVIVWDVAKGAVGGAISSAKEAMDQKKNPKK